MGTSINWLARLSQKDQERILGHIERLVKLENKLSKQIIEDEEMAMEYVENDIDAEEGISSVPIEINGKKYWIHKDVMHLIESLHKQLAKRGE
jgi:hypothetical protein